MLHFKDFSGNGDKVIVFNLEKPFLEGKPQGWQEPLMERLRKKFSIYCSNLFLVLTKDPVCFSELFQKFNSAWLYEHKQEQMPSLVATKLVYGPLF